jgi:hypothetical protein
MDSDGASIAAGVLTIDQRAAFGQNHAPVNECQP